MRSQALRHAGVDSKVISSRLQEWADWARVRAREDVVSPPAPLTPIAAIMARRINEIDQAISLLGKNGRYVIERLYRDKVSLSVLGRRFAWSADGVNLAYVRPAYRQIAKCISRRRSPPAELATVAN